MKTKGDSLTMQPSTSDEPTKLAIIPIDDSIKGLPKSGRKWKSPKTRYSSLRRDKPLHTSWAKKKELREQKNAVKLIQTEISETRKAANLEKKRMREEREQRKLENQRKAEVVQKVKNVHKLKRMKKKQLRRIEKRGDDDD